MTQRSKSTLFLIEQLIVIAVFAICATACVSILTAAYFYTDDSSSTSNAIIRAESAAEVFKASDGDYTKIASILKGSAVPGTSNGSVVTIFYDSSWAEVSEYGASYVLRVLVNSPAQNSQSNSIITGEVSVGRITGEELVSFPVAARTK